MNPQGPRKFRLRRVANKDQKRAARPCDNCRQRKERCDGGVPCRRCFRLRRQCRFSGRNSGGREVRSTASITPQSEGGDQQSSELVQRVHYLERIVQHRIGNVSLDLDTLQRLAEAADRGQQSPGPPDISSQQTESAVVNERCSIQPLNNNITHYSGEFSHWNFSMRVKQWIDQCVPQNHARGTTNSRKEFYRSEELQSPSSALASVSSFPPRSIADFLIHCFFKHAETNYFYVEKDWLVAKLDIAYSNAISLTRSDVGTMCVIFSVLAIGTQYAYLESVAEWTDDTAQYRHADSAQFTGDTVGVMFYHQACRLLPDAITLSSIESVQACLLLGIYTLPLDASGLAWIYLGIAVKLAIQNGMHRRCSEDSLGTYVRETRNRTWWSVYTLERRVGIFHGRPMSIARSDIDTDLPIDRTNVWPPATSARTACILATLELNDVLSKMFHEISFLRTTPKNEVSERPRRLARLQRELVGWWESLPNEVICKEPPTEPTSHLQNLRPSMQLKLEYCLVRMFAGRCFILSEPCARENVSNSTNSPTSTHSTTTPSQRSQPRSILVADCVDAALTVIETCRFLHNTIGLARSSYTEFSSCRAALLVITTQCLQTKEYNFRHALREGLTMLKEMAAGAELARAEVSLIESFERVIAKLDSLGNVSWATDSEFVRFKTWENSWRQNSSLVDLFREEYLMPTAPAPSFLPDWSQAADVTSNSEANLSMPLWTPFVGSDRSLSCFPSTLDSEARDATLP